jgi:hypothetical protein
MSRSRATNLKSSIRSDEKERVTESKIEEICETSRRDRGSEMGDGER